MSVSTRRTHPAQFASNCATCTTAISPGDLLFYAPGNENPIGLDCCGDRDDTDLVAHQRPEEGLSVDDEDPTVAIARVMPRNRTARDACPKCWLIPAGNGTCGCNT